MAGVSGSADEGFEALRRLLKRLDAGEPLEGLVYEDDPIRKTSDLMDLLFRKPAEPWMTPEQEELYLSGIERQREVAREMAQREEQDYLDELFNEVEEDEKFRIYLRNLGIDI